MSQYNFVSPGAAAGAGLEDVLTQARAQRRQQMLDEITRKNVESEISARREQSETAARNAASAAEERQGMAAWRNAQMQDINDKRQAREQGRQGRHEFISGLPTDVDPKIKQGLQLADASDDDELFKTIMNRYLQPNPDDQYVAVLDDSGNTVNWAPKGSIHLPRTPATPRQSFTAPGLTTDDGRLVTVIDGVPHAINPKTGKNEVYSGKIGAKPVQPRQGSGTLPAAMFNKIADLRKKATPTPGMLWGSRDPNPQDVAAYNQAQQNAIAAYPTSQDVRDTAMDIVFGTMPDPKDPKNTLPKIDPNMPTSKVIESYLDPNDFSDPSELEQLSNLLQLIRGI